MAKSASALREIRTRLHLSQGECAAALGVAVETFRAWDAGRRAAPSAVLQRAQTLTARRPPHTRVPLHVLANELHVHVRTLRAAAKDGLLGRRIASTKASQFPLSDAGPDQSADCRICVPTETLDRIAFVGATLGARRR